MNAVAAIASALHLLALAIGLPSVLARARALRGPLDAAGLRRVFAADAGWGVAAVLWLATGPLRAFAPLEKGAVYYLTNGLFHLKLGLFVLIFALELWPMVTLIRWRLALAREEAPDVSGARTLARLSDLEAALVLVIVGVSSFMARGFGMR